MSLKNYFQIREKAGLLKVSGFVRKKVLCMHSMDDQFDRDGTADRFDNDGTTRLNS